MQLIGIEHWNRQKKKGESFQYWTIPVSVKREISYNGDNTFNRVLKKKTHPRLYSAISFFIVIYI